MLFIFNEDGEMLSIARPEEIYLFGDKLEPESKEGAMAPYSAKSKLSRTKWPRSDRAVGKTCLGGPAADVGREFSVRAA